MTDKFQSSRKQVLFVGVIIIFLFLFTRQNNLLKLPNEFGMRTLENTENISDYIRLQMSICYQMKFSDKCYQAVGSLFMQQFDFETILDEFKLGEDSPEIFGKCHEVTHYIGRKAYQRERSIPELFSKGTSVCWGGFYHGVVEGYFEIKNITNPDKFAEEIKKVCGDRGDYESPRVFNECVHGIGHAMMFISNLDLPKSLKWCDELPGVLPDACYGGVFMENSSSSTNSTHPTKYLKADDPFYPCNILEKKYLAGCYHKQSSYFARLVKWDWKKNAELCMQIPTPYQNVCFFTIGSNQVGAIQNISDMQKTCQSMPSFAVKRECVKGVIGGLSGRYRGDPSRMIEFCNIVEKEFQEDCWAQMGKSTSDWTVLKNDADSICRAPTKKLAESCRKYYFFISSP